MTIRGKLLDLIAEKSKEKIDKEKNMRIYIIKGQPCSSSIKFKNYD